MNWSDEQIMFQNFLATPKSQRRGIFGTEYETHYAEHVLKVTKATTATWKKLPGWVEAVNQIAIGRQQSKLGELYDAIFDAAIEKKDPRTLKLAVEVASNLVNTLVINDHKEELRTLSEDEVMDKISKLLDKARKVKDKVEVVNN